MASPCFKQLALNSAALFGSSTIFSFRSRLFVDISASSFAKSSIIFCRKLCAHLVLFWFVLIFFIWNYININSLKSGICFNFSRFCVMISLPDLRFSISYFILNLCGFRYSAICNQVSCFQFLFVIILIDHLSVIILNLLLNTLFVGVILSYLQIHMCLVS